MKEINSMIFKIKKKKCNLHLLTDRRDHHVLNYNKNDNNYFFVINFKTFANANQCYDTQFSITFLFFNQCSNETILTK